MWLGCKAQCKGSSRQTSEEEELVGEQLSAMFYGCFAHLQQQRVAG